MRRILTMGLIALILLAACGRAGPAQPATAGQDSPTVTIFKPPT